MISRGRYDQPVSDLPPPPVAPPLPPRWQQPMPPAPRPQRSRFAFLTIALLVTLGVAIGGWFRPLPYKPPPAPTYTAQQSAAAKAKVCAAYAKVHSAVGVTMARDGGADPTAQLAVATSARQALLAGSEYLLTNLSEEPATAPDLAAAVRKLASLFQEYTVEYLSGRTNSDIESSLRAGDETTLTIEKLCK
jgi:hypothetical protein